MADTGISPKRVASAASVGEEKTVKVKEGKGTTKRAKHLEDYFQPSASSAKNEPLPTARWGHTFDKCGRTTALLFGGQGKDDLCRDTCWTYEFGLEKWHQHDSKDESSPVARTGHATCVDHGTSKLFLVGGAKNKRVFSDIHEYDASTSKWKQIEVESGHAPIRSYHTATLYRNEIFVFGGVIPMTDPTPDTCSADLHIFNIGIRNWYSPIVFGEKPSPRSGHTATQLDDQIIIIGGWDAPVCYNDVFILDLMTMEFERLQLAGNAPTPRCWHTAILLPGTRNIIVCGGYDGTQALQDSFILNLNEKRWQQLDPSLISKPTAGHRLIPSLDERHLIAFGGGDNEGAFYGRPFSFPAPL